MQENRPKAVVLLSGGLDSATVLAIALSEGYDPYAITFRYGQRHEQEIEAAGRIAKLMNLSGQTVVDINLRQFGGSALTDDIEVPKSESIEQIGDQIPVTYVPARNTIFLSFALAWAETLGANDVFIGVNALDYSGYPDCRPEYVAAFEKMANLATKASVQGEQRLRIHVPLIDMTKAQIISKGMELGVDYGMTTSCYDPVDSGAACGHCDACLLRLRGFAENRIDDPATYASEG